MGQDSSAPPVLMRSVFVATRPSRLCGIFFARKSARIFSELSDVQEITMRDCDSLKRTAAADLWPASARPTEPRLQTERSTFAPKRPLGLKHDSASATASPPSEQSCALFTSPARINSRTEF